MCNFRSWDLLDWSMASASEPKSTIRDIRNRVNWRNYVDMLYSTSWQYGVVFLIFHNADGYRMWQSLTNG